MAYKLTKREVLENNIIVIKVGFCDLQNLLHYKERLGYTCGIYGWNADIYLANENNTISICTGYRPFGERVPYEITKEYDMKAGEIVHTWGGDFDEKKEKVNNLLKEYVEICRKIISERRLEERKENK